MSQLEGELQGSLPIGAVSLAVVAKKVAKGTFSITNCKGYISTPQTSMGQACKATRHASRKDWQSHPSSLWHHILSLAYSLQGTVARYGYDLHRWSLPP